jgi:hypothetical protein
MELVDSKCPKCGSDGIDGDSPEIEGNGKVRQVVWCTTCEQEWVAVYSLTAIELF